jgi:hypothetical protein
MKLLSIVTMTNFVSGEQKLGFDPADLGRKDFREHILG